MTRHLALFASGSPSAVCVIGGQLAPRAIRASSAGLALRAEKSGVTTGCKSVPAYWRTGIFHKGLSSVSD